VLLAPPNFSTRQLYRSVAVLDLSRASKACRHIYLDGDTDLPSVDLALPISESFSSFSESIFAPDVRSAKRLFMSAIYNASTEVFNSYQQRASACWADPARYISKADILELGLELSPDDRQQTRAALEKPA